MKKAVGVFAAAPGTCNVFMAALMGVTSATDVAIVFLLSPRDLWLKSDVLAGHKDLAFRWLAWFVK